MNWYKVHRAWMWFEVPFVFIHHLVNNYLWYLAHYKYGAGKHLKISPTPFSERCSRAWYIAIYGED